MIEKTNHFNNKHAKNYKRFKRLFIITIIATYSLYLSFTYNFNLKSKNTFQNDDTLSKSSALKLYLDTLSESNLARNWSYDYTRGPHLAGQGLNLIDYTIEKFQEYGLKTSTESYPVLLNYPLDHGLKLLNKNGSIIYQPSLEEDILKQDETTGLSDRIPTFHGYSASGNVTGKFLYVGYGRKEDFELLQSKGVSFKNKIIISKYGGLFRGLKVKFAQELGAIGIILYSDPGDDGEITIKNGYKSYPDGPARNPSSVQRGSVQFLSITPGDPTTPGYPSKEGVERKDPFERIPSIPSLPISYKEILPILKQLNGKGLNAKDLNDDFFGGLDDFDYSIGPSDLELNLFNLQNYSYTNVNNVFGKIEGSLKNDETIIIGNHRDAWIAGGAGDPNSGSSIILEIARSLNELTKLGWKPLRSIIFASWDGEEYGLLGSTEWGEDKSKWLNNNALAYLNIDSGATGSVLGAAGSPLLRDLLYEIASIIEYPKGGTLLNHWNETSNGILHNLGSGSDYTVFQDFIGIPSLDVGFHGGSKDAIYQYHSNYDSFYWMEKFGDPGFIYHNLNAKFLGSILLELSQQETIKFGSEQYGKDLFYFFNKAKDLIPKKWLNNDLHEDEENSCHSININEFNEFDTFNDLLNGINTILTNFTTNGLKFDNLTSSLQSQLDTLNSSPPKTFGFKDWIHKLIILSKIKGLNKHIQYLDRILTYSKGLDNIEWFKHIVYAPGRYTGYAGQVFPGLLEAIEDDDYERAVKWSKIIYHKIKIINDVVKVKGVYKSC